MLAHTQEFKGLARDSGEGSRADRLFPCGDNILSTLPHIWPLLGPWPSPACIWSLLSHVCPQAGQNKCRERSILDACWHLCHTCSSPCGYCHLCLDRASRGRVGDKAQTGGRRQKGARKRVNKERGVFCQTIKSSRAPDGTEALGT